jgi:hypothetical protein
VSAHAIRWRQEQDLDALPDELRTNDDFAELVAVGPRRISLTFSTVL